MEYQKDNKYFAQVSGSLEQHAATELTALGATILKIVPRGLQFSCSQKNLYHIVYSARLVQRVLAPLLFFKCLSDKDLYNYAYKQFDWTQLFATDQSFSIDSNVSDSNIKHSLYAGQLLKDAICDRFRDKYSQRPNFDTTKPDISFNLHIRENLATISLDLTGISMHKRGYRVMSNLAPLQETLAAALIVLSGWQGEKPLLDPMCGSGTILAEALMRYCHIPAGYLRQDKGLEYLPDYNPTLWANVKDQDDSKIIPLPRGLIYGSDINPKNVEATRINLMKLPGGENVELEVTAFQDIPRHGERCIVTNPPYGIRIGSADSTIKLYNELGDFLKQKCPASEAYVLCGSKELVPELRLRAHWKKSLKNADLEVKLAKIIMR
ncbi:MAG: RNA methyltransferase [Candidatus Cloacimonetes bacterium HGW-Cloacimonetes-1]|jgi:putative N6-adenine-specific DNA methylase|nr:MAG: RNA methyltransferase [Candidatus Cloacimonetes bacterium HGW-Cloacimonetes-1]